MYAYLFNDFLNEYNLEKNELPTLINLFNNYDGKLKLYDDAKSTLKILKEKYYKLGIITDGNLLKQKRKIKLLGIDNFLNIIIYTKELDVSKPSPTPFEKALKELNVYPKNSFYVGDNPLVDFKGAKESGMNTIRIMKGEFKSLPSDDYIDCEIKNLKELLSIV
jgi:putative hydrolase of the HAD superfamily